MTLKSIPKRLVPLGKTLAVLCLCRFPTVGQTPPPIAPEAPVAQTAIAAPNCSRESNAEPRRTGTLRGTVVDVNSAAVVGADVTLTRDDPPASQKSQTDDGGQFFFVGIVAGTYHLKVSGNGFADQSTSGMLNPGENCEYPRIVLPVATNVTQVKVELTPIEIAQEQLETQEQQRVLGVIPNFYVTYEQDALPLNTKQKFQLAWKSTIDPVSIGVTAVIAGVGQATDAYSGYGQGAEGYGKRFGAAYADLLVGTYISGAILPSVFKQDPRYFYKGTGSGRSRLGYALANAVICKGDNGHWQPNYSLFLGSLAAGGISNLYYPENDRNGFGLTVTNTLVGLAQTAAINVLQEFVMRKLTPNIPGLSSGSAKSNASP